jgi:hypothetical protein
MKVKKAKGRKERIGERRERKASVSTKEVDLKGYISSKRL